MKLEDFKDLPKVDLIQASGLGVKPREIAEVEFEDNQKRVLYVAGIDRRRETLVCGREILIDSNNINYGGILEYLIKDIINYTPIQRC